MKELSVSLDELREMGEMLRRHIGNGLELGLRLRVFLVKMGDRCITGFRDFMMGTLRKKLKDSIIIA